MEVSGQLHALATLSLIPHCTGGWVILRDGLDRVAKRKIS